MPLLKSSELTLGRRGLPGTSRSSAARGDCLVDCGQSRRSPRRLIGACLGTFVLGLVGMHLDGRLRADELSGRPVAAEATLDRFELHPDLRIELVACEPDVIDPVDMAFDPEGRLWVVEMSDYPLGPAEGQPPRSRIRVLTDEDGDGHYGNPVTFADELLFATGLLLWRDGALVTLDGELVFLRDRDGDGRADAREAWFGGFKQENPQLRANHPTLGLDNRVYVASGLRGGEVSGLRADGSQGNHPVSLSNFDFVFDPLTGEYGVTTGVGQFGQCFDDWGNRFVCSNRNPCKHIVLADRYLSRNPQLRITAVHEDVSPAGEESRLFPISRTWTTSNLHANQFTAACGVQIYRGHALPAEFRGNCFICEPTGNLVHRDVLSPLGASFTSRPGRDGVEFLATRDEWFRPVNLQHGPDGALYVVDMYRAVIEHPQFMPEELKTRSDLTDGDDRGRIYRIVPRRRDPRLTMRAPRLSSADNPTLVTHLDSGNVWLRETAARLLLERLDSTTAPRLRELARVGRTPQGRVRALWLLDALELLSEDVVAVALEDPHPRVREQAALLADLRFASQPALRDRLVELLADPASDPRLLFQCVQSLGGFQLSASDVTSIAGIAVRFGDDPWLRTAVASSVGDAMPLVLETMLTRNVAEMAASPERLIPLIREFAGLVGSRGQEAEMLAVLRSIAGLGQDDESLTPALRRSQWAACQGLGSALRPSGNLRKLSEQLHESDLARAELMFEAVSQAALDPQLTTAVRRESLAALACLDGPTARPALLQILDGETDRDVLVAAIEALSRHVDETVATRLLTDFRSTTPVLQRVILSSVLASSAGTRCLLDLIDQGEISARDIDLSTTGRLTRHRDAAIRERAQQLLATEISADRRAVLDAYRPVLTLAGDPLAGRQQFTRTCATCHRIGEIGVNVAPDISDSRVKTPEQILTDILDPNRAIDSNYFGYTILEKSGRVHTGVVSAETAATVTLRQPEGKTITVLRDEIEQLSSTGQSLMPVGLEKDISTQQMADLIAFIKNWRYLDGAVPSDVIR